MGVFLADEVIGGSGLHRRRGPHGLEIGYWVHIDHTRCGYASEVAAAMTTTAFTIDGIERVEIHHDKANVASAGVPRRLGFAPLPDDPQRDHRTGRDRHRLWLGDATCDVAQTTTRLNRRSGCAPATDLHSPSTASAAAAMIGSTSSAAGGGITTRRSTPSSANAAAVSG